MKRTSRLFLVLGAVFAVLFSGLSHQSVDAGKSDGWSPDEKVPGYLDDTFTPFLLVDRNRTVHAFASQWVDADGRRLAIVYRQWTLRGGWTRPVDIILSPIGGSANFTGAFLDASDTMHIIFTATENITRRTYVFYSHAPAASADLAFAWSPPVIVGDSALDLNSGAIIGDNQGNLVIIYSGNRDGSGVYYTHSKDSGLEWSTPSSTFLTSNEDLSTFSLHLAIGPEQRIRAAWNVVTNVGVDEALYFANFDTTNSGWETPVELERRIDILDYFGPSFPVIVDNGQKIVIVYNSGNPFAGRPVGAGRPIQRVRVSTNNGLSWNEPLDPFPFHVGRSGEHTLALDGDGNPHTLFTQRIESTDRDGNYSVIGGIWHSVFQDGVWTNPDRLVSSVPAHDVRAVIVQGNILLVVWREDPGVGQSGIWYSYSILDIPELPVTPLATVPADDFGEEATPGAISELGTPEPTPALEQLPNPELWDEAPTSDLGRNPALPIIIGTVPVILLLIGVVVGYRFLTHRREQDEIDT